MKAQTEHELLQNFADTSKKQITNMEDLLLPLRQKILAVSNMDVIIPGTDEQILKFALRSELKRLCNIDSVSLPIRELIKIKLRDIHLTGSELSAMTGISQSKVSRYLSGLCNIKSDELELILTKLKIL